MRTSSCSRRMIQAHQAIWALAQTPLTSVPFLQANLQPAVEPEPQKLAALISDLASDRFASREQATQQLAQLGDVAVARIKQALAANQPLETRRRLEALLAKLESTPITTATLRQV